MREFVDVCAIPTPHQQVNPEYSSSNTLTKLISFIPIIGNDYATTIKDAGNNQYGEYATIEQTNTNKLATDQEILDQEDIERLKDKHDDNVQIASKLNLTEAFETSPMNSAWVGTAREPIDILIDSAIDTACRSIENDKNKQQEDFDLR